MGGNEGCKKGRKEGRKGGRKKGRKEGKEEGGRKKGRKKGRKEGRKGDKPLTLLLPILKHTHQSLPRTLSSSLYCVPHVRTVCLFHHIYLMLLVID